MPAVRRLAALPARADLLLDLVVRNLLECAAQAKVGARGLKVAHVYRAAAHMVVQVASAVRPGDPQHLLDVGAVHAPRGSAHPYGKCLPRERRRGALQLLADGAKVPGQVRPA